MREQRYPGESEDARAALPMTPDLTHPDFMLSLISSVAILATITVASITSGGLV
uniref:Uncharacterized protein n=1 Tax=Candidatus Kentrum sp. LPFa TaxID=2126335 RepID=A0A450VWH8_9GAMM|nr:MAG: hypothetical protein BECKLPF1236B_GA0070989_100527 [Candidatus Kentron sp. LPFa]